MSFKGCTNETKQQDIHYHKHLVFFILLSTQVINTAYYLRVNVTEIVWLVEMFEKVYEVT
jgi:hypothetical protein